MTDIIGSMDYSEARDAFFSPRPAPAQTLDWSTPARRLRDAVEPLATVCYWSEPAYDAYAAHGLDFLLGYVWGRTSSLGEPEPLVAASSFGVFEPGLVTGLYAAGREALGLAEMRAARVAGSVEALRQSLGDPAALDGLDATLAALETAVAAAPLVGRPMFAGLLGSGWPEDPFGRLWHACNMLREHRGDGHLAALAGAGLDGVQANVLTELWVGWDLHTYTGSRGWSPEAMAEATAALEARGLVADGALSDAGRALREQLEATTDAGEQSVVDALDATDDGLDVHVDRLAGWAQQVIDRGWFPPDPYKRAAG